MRGRRSGRDGHRAFDVRHDSVPARDQYADRGNGESGKYPLIRCVQTTHHPRQLKVSLRCDCIRFSTDHRAAALADRRHGREENARHPMPTGGRAGSNRSQCHNQPGQDREATKHFDHADGVAEPQPLDRHGRWRRQTMDQQHRQTGADAWQSLKERCVTETKTHDPTEEKPRQKFTGQARAPTVGDDSENDRGHQ